jgi:hypothetical protein
MTREQILTMFPNATDEQVTAMLNAHHKEVQAEKRNAEMYKTGADEANTLREQLAELQNKGLSDAERMQNQIKAQEKQIAELMMQNQMAEIGAYASSKGLVGEQAQNIIKSFVGNVEAAKTAIDSIVGLKGEWESAAALAKEQEIAKASSNPGGGTGTGGSADDNKSSAVKYVEQHFSASKGDNQNILNHYLGR